MQRLIDMNKRIAPGVSKMHSGYGLGFVLAGLLFLGWAAYVDIPRIRTILVPAGALFMAGGAFFFFWARRWRP